jgi:hypothetical protein
MPTELRFRKTGAEIKAAAASKMAQIQARLKRRYESLDEFMRDQNFVRSYLIRSSKSSYGMHGGRSLWSETDISSERMEEIRQLCERIYDLESEMHRLQLVVAHLADNQSFDLAYEDLAGYGFEV